MKLHTPFFMALSFALFAPASQAQTSDPDVQKLIGQVATAYRGLTSLSTTLVMAQGSGPTEQKVTTLLKFKKPNMLSATITFGENVGHVVADGTTLYVDSSRDDKQYLKQPGTKPDDVLGALVQSGGAGVGLLPYLLTSTTLEKQIIPGKSTSMKHMPDQKVEAENCDVLTVVTTIGDSPHRIEFDFGKQDHLLRRLTMGPPKAGEKPAVIETYSDVDTHPTFTDATFKFTPHAGAVATDQPKEPDRFDPRIKVGADPLPISGKDLSGKTVSLDQFKGKVLLIDFWATWCGPCVAELPNVIAAYGKYHGKGFEVLGISLDQDGSKEKVAKFIKDKQMPWQQIYDGKYWEAANAVAYGVRSIPFTVLLGRDGKIAAVGARGELLAPAIEAALAK